jgi:hypothetical protein
MHHRYEPPTDPAARVFHQTLGTGDPYRDSPTITTPATGPIEEFPGQARATGLRRLSKLTWRATQLSAVTAVGFATLFARTAPAQAVSETTRAPSTEASASASLAGTPTHSAGHRHYKRARTTTPGVRPTAQAGQAATAPSTGSSSPGPSNSSSKAPSSSAPSSSSPHSSSAPPTLAPPSSAPAPAPPPSSAPAPPPPPPPVSSGSHGGG